jgi:GT2 family glycosyltransferase
VCFLDDDIIPTPDWIRALADDADVKETKVLHMGYCPHAPSGIRTHLDRRNAAWYESKIRIVRDPRHELCFTDFFGGNFAVERAEFTTLGGFDPRFFLGEDFELAFRALRSGWRIRFVPGARAEHYAHRDAHAYGRQAFRAGQADALFVRVHPEGRSEVRIGIRRRPLKRVAGVAWRAVALRTAVAVQVVEGVARLGELLRLRPVLDLAYALLWDGQYWRGVATA